jgi:hypothetical protein
MVQLSRTAHLVDAVGVADSRDRLLLWSGERGGRGEMEGHRWVAATAAAAAPAGVSARDVFLVVRGGPRGDVQAGPLHRTLDAVRELPVTAVVATQQRYAERSRVLAISRETEHIVTFHQTGAKLARQLVRHRITLFSCKEISEAHP